MKSTLFKAASDLRLWEGSIRRAAPYSAECYPRSRQSLFLGFPPYFPFLPLLSIRISHHPALKGRLDLPTNFRINTQQRITKPFLRNGSLQYPIPYISPEFGSTVGFIFSCLWGRLTTLICFA